MSRCAKIKAKIDNIRISPEMAERIHAALKFHGMSLDEFIEDSLRLNLGHLDHLQFEMDRDEKSKKTGAGLEEMERLKERFDSFQSTVKSELEEIAVAQLKVDIANAILEGIAQEGQEKAAWVMALQEKVTSQDALIAVQAPVIKKFKRWI